MKKSIVATLGGVALGIIMMVGVFFVLNMEPVNEDVMAQNTVKNESENDVTVVDDEAIDDNLLAVEMETEEGTEILEDSESPQDEVEKSTTVATTQLPYYIKVNRQANCVTIYTLDADGNYTVPVKAMVCSVGLNGKTPLGVSKITDKYTWRLLFGDTYGQYSVRFNGHILFHSVPYLTTSNDTLKEGQFNLLGEAASLGCIRLCVADAKWIYDNCAKGTVVEVYDSADPGPLGKPSMPKISADSPFRGWDPTDPNPSNPWLYGTVSMQGVKDIILTAGETVDLLEGVSATDVDGLGIDVTVSGNVDFNTPGSYQITYTATGVLGDTVTKTAIVTVLALETEEPETQAPETQVPETGVPETQVPETETQGTEATETAETEVMETQVPETQGTEN